VYRGDKEPDLTVRAVVAGMIFGGLMSLSNLYVGLKSGWCMGVDIAAVIVIFAVFKALHGTLRHVGLEMREFGMMENTITMTVSVAASWIASAGLISAVPALTMLTGYKFIWWQLVLFIAAILYLGLFMAIPLKRQMIQVESLRFPGNIPTGETLLVMYSHGGEAIKKAVALGIAGLVGAAAAGLREGIKVLPNQFDNLPWRLQGVTLAKLTIGIQPGVIFIGIGALCGIKVGLSVLLGTVLNYGILAPCLIDKKIIEHAPPKIEAIAATQLPLTIERGQKLAFRLEEAIGGPELPTPEPISGQPELSPAVDTTVLHYTWRRRTTYENLSDVVRDLNAKTLQDGSANPLYGRLIVGTTSITGEQSTMLTIASPDTTHWEAKLSLPTDQSTTFVKALGFTPGEESLKTVGGFENISHWSLWPGATVLVVGGLLSLAFQWRSMGRTFASIFTGLGGKRNAPKGALDHLEVPMTWFFFGFIVTGVLAALLLMWIFSIKWWMGVVAVLLTFFLAAVAARAAAEIGMTPIGALGKVTQLTYGVLAPNNVSANLMTAGLTGGAAASCADTVGNLKVGHMVGANPRKQFIAQIFGVMAGAVLAVPAYFILVPDANTLGGEKFPAPSALVWKGVAEILSKGLHTLPSSAIWAVGVAFVIGVVIVIVDRLFPKIKPYTPSPAALGMAMTMPASNGIGIFLGALIVWILEKKAAKWSDMYTIPVASGCIAGESIMGVIIAILTVLGLVD
jgi:uncharacterized oligopeptide transporter (OPT) family protein